MVLPKEPVPGQKLDATWGRDVVRALKRLTPSGGPGMRVTCGPNGTTFAAVGRAAQAGATEQAAEAELLAFRIGVGVETIESGSSVTYKYHCVAVCADLMTDGVGYSEINTTVPDDSKLGGLPLGKAGSGLSWVWLKDADFADVTEESETSPTENVYLHIDRTRHLCVLANADTLTIPDGTDFTSDDHICVASFTPPTKDVPKPSVCGQYVLGSLVDLCEADTKRPFSLRVYTDSAGVSYPAVYLPYSCVQIDETTLDEGGSVIGGTVMNGAVSGMEADWYVVSNGFASDGSLIASSFSNITFTNGLADVYLFVAAVEDATLGMTYQCFLAVSDGDGTWPSSVAEDARVAKAYVGAFKKETVNEVAVYSVASQIVNDAYIVKMDDGADEELHPFKTEWFNAGSEASPNWKLTVFMPEGSINTASSILYSQLTACAERPGWAEVAIPSTNLSELETLALRLCTATSDKWDHDSVRTYVQFGFRPAAFDYSGIEGFDSTRTEKATLPIARVDVANKKILQQFAFSAYSVQTVIDENFNGGDGSGTVVSVTDNRKDTSVPGLLGMDDAAQAEGNLKLIAYDGLGFDKVVAGDGANQATLTDYLAGSVEVTAGDSKLGKNINTENFETECLAKGGESADTTVGSATTAARSDHTHKADEIDGYDEAMEELKADIYSNVDFIDSVAASASEKIDISGKVATVVPQKDGTGSAGSASAGLAAGDHEHPLNIGTDENSYAAGNHSHGNIDKDGKISGANGNLLTIATDGTIEVAASIVPNNLASVYDEDIGCLAALLELFYYDASKATLALSTDKLRYPSSGGHSENCLLYVDADRNVVHTGNDAYNAVKDLSENNYDAATKKVKFNYGAIGLKDTDVAPSSPKAVGFDEGADTASLLDVATLAPKEGEDGASADNAPVADAVKQSDGGSVTDLARVGTSSYAARADHVHPVCMEMGSTKTLTEAATGDTLPSTVPLDTSTWKPGANGVEESYCSRAVVLGTVRWFLFRKRKISKTGQVVYIGPEYVGFRVRYS